MKHLLPFIFLFHFISCTSSLDTDSPLSVQGTLNLNKFNLASRSIFLEGDWEFYWNRLLEPKDFKNQEFDFERNFLAPGTTWSGTTLDTLNLKNTGIATYRIKIIFPEDAVGSIHTLRIRTTGGAAYRIYIYDTLHEEIGKVGEAEELTLPSRKGANIDFVVQDQSTPVIVQVASFHHFEGSFWYAPELGTSKIISRLQKFDLTMSAILLGSILLMALYHLVVYYHRREKQSLYFSLFSLSVGIYQMSIGELIVFHIYPDLPYLIAHRLLILFFLTAGFYISFLKSVFPNDIPSYFVRIVWIISIAMFSFAFFTPVSIGSYFERYATIFSVIVLFIGLIFLVRTVFIKRKDSRIMFFSNLVIWLGAINDGLVIFSYYNGVPLLSYAIFFSIMIQSIFLARRFSRAFSDVESLSTELKKLNMNLESKIEERTTEYRAEKEKAEEANIWKGKFIELVSHNIRSPLYGIYSSLELISEEDYMDQEERINLIKLTKSTILNTTSAVENLLHSSRFLDDSIHINKTSFLPYAPIDSLISQMNVTAKEKKILIRNLVSRDFAIHADLDITTEVFRNLLMNGIKFTGLNGTITIETEEVSDYLLIHFSDTGIGISPDILPLLFQSTISTSGTKGEKGFGIGLKRSQELMHLQGGRIEVESSPNEGSRFTVWFTNQGI